MAQPLKHPQSESVLSSNNIKNGDILVLANPGTHSHYNGDRKTVSQELDSKDC